MTLQRAFQAGAVALALAGLAGLVALSLARTDGHLTYALDDPYIHLAVAENILRGGYGVNLGEFSAPSSSILYPYLLAALLWIGFGDWSPLVTGAVGAAVSAWVISGLLWSRTTVPGLPRSQVHPFLALPLLLVTISVLALPMTGMEHSLHVAVSLVIVAGLGRLDRDDPVPPWLVAAMILAPLVRFEGAALFLGAVAALLWYRKFAAAALAVAVTALIVGAFTLMLVQNGMAILPSSVMVKSPVVTAAIGAHPEAASLGAQIAEMVNDLQGGARHRRGVILSFAVILFAFSAAWRGPERENRLVIGLALSFALMAHMAFGKYEPHDRYDVYVIAIAMAGLLIVYTAFLRDPEGSFFFKGLGILCYLAIAGAPYYEAARDTPAASHNIWQQQYQMHRFATEFFPETVAVNDLGYVAYQNDNFVLDLWGLGSERARLSASLGGKRTVDGLRELTAGYDVPFAMIYDEWFEGAIPPEWCKIAELSTVEVTAASGFVAIYLIDPAREADFSAALDRFQAALPPPAELLRYGCAAR